ncbi:MAG: hypothetical protein WKF59_16415 [Chitinophagaceae bacterium]
MEKSLRSMRGCYGDMYEYQSERSLRGELFYTYFGAGDILLFMFLGMAFFKSGILMGQAPTKIYLLLFIGGMGLGLLLSYFRLQPQIDLKFDFYAYLKKDTSNIMKYHGLSEL